MDPFNYFSHQLPNRAQTRHDIILTISPNRRTVTWQLYIVAIPRDRNLCRPGTIV